MIECSVKTQVNGKPFTYRYGILVDDVETGRPLPLRHGRSKTKRAGIHR